MCCVLYFRDPWGNRGVHMGGMGNNRVDTEEPSFIPVMVCPENHLEALSTVSQTVSNIDHVALFRWVLESPLKSRIFWVRPWIARIRVRSWIWLIHGSMSDGTSLVLVSWVVPLSDFLEEPSIDLTTCYFCFLIRFNQRQCDNSRHKLFRWCSVLIPKYRNMWGGALRSYAPRWFHRSRLLSGALFVVWKKEAVLWMARKLSDNYCTYVNKVDENSTVWKTDCVSWDVASETFCRWVWIVEQT